MGKGKAGKVPNKHIHSRVAFLHQAAIYLTTQHAQAKETCETASDKHTSLENDKRSVTKTMPASVSALRLTADLRDMSRKTQIRLSRDVKRSLCKRCNTCLVPGYTSRTYMENKSKGGRKSRADVLVIECFSCGAAKRLPIGSTRQRPKAERTQKKHDEEAEPVTVQEATEEVVDSVVQTSVEVAGQEPAAGATHEPEDTATEMSIATTPMDTS